MLEQAIRDREVIAFTYDGAPRLVMPHAYGRTAKGKLVLRGFQILGESQTTGEMGWKLFSVDKIPDVTLTGQNFDTPAAGYQPGDKQMAQIIAELAA